MERKFIKGECTEDCLDSIDLILQHWAPKLGNYIIGVIPPIPILHHQTRADEKGCIFAGILPFTGRISRAFLAISTYRVKPITLTITVLSTVTQAGARIEADKPMISYQSDILVTAGDIVRVTIDPVDGAEEFLVGILCHPDISHADRERQMVSELKLLDQLRED